MAVLSWNPRFLVGKDSLQVWSKSNNKWSLYIWLQTQMLAFKGVISLWNFKRN